jgi:hypothetical protein
MSRRTHAHAEDFTRTRDIGVAGLGLFAQPTEPAPPAPAPAPSPSEERKAKAQLVRDAECQRWIDANRPIAEAVARRDGIVTSASFRREAELRHSLPPTYGQQRALSWISAMFADLCADRVLQKQRHPNGAPVRLYDRESRNDQVVYELTERAA